MEKNFRWRKSTRSEAYGNCVELAWTDPGGVVRDSKNPDGPMIRPVIAGWAAFIGTVRSGSLDHRA